MCAVSGRLREKISELGVLSQPLGEQEAKRFAQLITSAVFNRISKGESVDEVIDFYRIQIMELAQRKRTKHSRTRADGLDRHPNLASVLKVFSASDHFLNR